MATGPVELLIQLSSKGTGVGKTPGEKKTGYNVANACARRLVEIKI